MCYYQVCDGMNMLVLITAVAPSCMYMDYLPDTVVLREKLGPRDRPSYVCVSKLKRTKPFYVAEFEALKALTRPEVCLFLCHGRL